MTLRKSRIYLLRDPNTNQIRYVGQCVTSIDDRLRRHVKFSRIKESKWTKKENWIRSLGDSLPIVELIEECLYEDADTREIFYINLYRSQGHPLTNLTEGGKGRIFRGSNHPSFGKALSLETKRKIGDANRGIKNGMHGKSIIQSAETRLKRGSALRNSQRFKESRASSSFKKKLSESMRDTRPIIFINAETNEIKFRFNSVYEAAEKLSCTRCNIFHAIKDERPIGKRIKSLAGAHLVKYETMEIPQEFSPPLVGRSDKG